MKKLVLVVCLLVASLAARAQFEQGKWIINPSLTGLNFSYSNSEKAQFGIGAKAGAFLAEGIPITIWYIKNNEKTNLTKSGVFLGAGLDLNRYSMKGGHTGTEWGVGIEAGYAYFLSRTVTIEPAIYYKWRFNDSDLSKFGLKVGFGFYF